MKKVAQETNRQNKKRIKRISVTNLFGVFNHAIPLHLDDRITIIHGPNGFGKTAILKLVDALFSQDNNTLSAIPFDEFCIYFDDNTTFSIRKTIKDQKYQIQEMPDFYQITFYATGEQPFSTLLRSTHLSMTGQKIVIPHSIARDIWLHLPSGELLSVEDIIVQYNGRIPKEVIQVKEPTWLIKMRKAIFVHLIETQRLVNMANPAKQEGTTSENQSLIPCARIYSEELANTLKAKLAEYASLSQSLDRTFLERVFNPTTTQRNRDENELRHQLEALEEKRLNLTAAGLLDQGGGTAFALGDHVDESKKSMLSVYIEDTQKKLSVFDNLFEKIHLLTEIVNKRFLYKKMTIHKEQGFVFITSKNTSLPLENLSSGEQHELVLFYELLFKVAPGSLILIDEPELSLHIVWQKQFLQDVQEVTRLSDIDILIATHSPSIIHNRWDLTVGLEEPNN